jgi:hypothetical protein
MADVVLGVLAVLAGALLCFRGQVVLRLVFPIWGAFAGFAFGAGLVSELADERFLGSVLGWLLGLVFAVVFAVLAYLYYAVGVVLVMVSIGFTLGSGLVVALGIDWDWVAVLVGALAGAVLGVASVLVDVPMIVLVVLTAVAGAVAVVAGFMLLTGAVDSATFTTGDVVRRIDDDWWWYVAVLVLAVAGVVVQARDVATLRRSVRESWGTTSI